MAEDSKESITVSSIVYKKSYLHACKYLTDDVIGKLDGANIIVNDAFPLTHTRILAPTTEIAFEIVESLIQEQNDVIVGIYEGLLDPDKLDELSEITVKLMDKIAQNLNAAPVVMKIFETSEDTPLIKGTSLTGKVSRYLKKVDDKVNLKVQIDNNACLVEYGKLKNDILAGKHWKIVDFDNHFQDIALDFTNSFLLKQ